MKIAVYSGSFNPLHIGHEAIMRYLTQEGLFDWVYLVISPKNPLKSTISADSAEARYQAAVEAVRRHPDLKVKVDDIELKMPGPSYTIKTLDALKAREPDNDFTLVIGGDNLSCIRQWKHFPRILSDYGVVVYPREGTDLRQLHLDLIKYYLDQPEPYVLDWNVCEMDGENRFCGTLDEAFEHTYHIRTIEAPLFNISSTAIREGLEEGRDMSEYLM